MSAQVKDDGGPAFPFPVSQRDDGMILEGPWNGMTLRDYFAAKAMQGICGVLHEGIRPADIPVMARDAYLIADAMLGARK